MTVSHLHTKLKSLEDRHDKLLQDYESAHDEYNATLSDVDRNRLENRIALLESQLEAAEHAINETGDKILRLPVDQSGSGKLSSGTTLTVQVAVVAMTASQTNDLLPSNNVDKPEFAGAAGMFAEMHSHLTGNGVDNLGSCYGEEPDDWKPLLADGKQTIMQAIEDVLDKITRTSPSSAYIPTITLKSISKDLLSKEGNQRAAARKVLEKQGGLIVVDALSLYHPTIQTYLLSGQLFGQHPSVAMVVLSPLRIDKIPIYQVLQKQVYQAHLEKAFEHFFDHLDPFFEFNVHELCSLRRWLFSVVPHYKRRSMSPDARTAVVAEWGQSEGIVQYVSGRPWL